MSTKNLSTAVSLPLVACPDGDSRLLRTKTALSRQKDRHKLRLKMHFPTCLQADRRPNKTAMSSTCCLIGPTWKTILITTLVRDSDMWSITSIASSDAAQVRDALVMPGTAMDDMEDRQRGQEGGGEASPSKRCKLEEEMKLEQKC
jgi:hypothetical protein